ncbi:MAG: TlpA family protein disulfide reductase [Ruminococcus sp.]|nr:TlpA family protein disulfide reductase [Ruminococcus sp.]
MKNKITLIIIILAITALLVGSLALYNSLSDGVDTSLLSSDATDGSNNSENSQNPSVSAPDFTVYDADGKAVKLSDFYGKPTVVNFWASWCSPCKMEMPDFEEKYNEQGDKVNFLMVNMTDNSRETVKIASEFIASQGYTFPVYYDTEQSAAIAYSVYSLPTTYFIDASGNIVTYASGAINAETLQTGIDMIMN